MTFYVNAFHVHTEIYRESPDPSFPVSDTESDPRWGWLGLACETNHQHTHKTSKNFMYAFVLGPLQFQPTGQNTHLISKTVVLAMLAFKKNPTHLHSNQPKLSPVSCMLFPAHLQARELCPQTYSLSLPLEWSQVTHIPASIKSGGAYKPRKSAFYSTIARQLCDDTRLPGWLSAFPAHSQTFKPT